MFNSQSLQFKFTLRTLLIGMAFGWAGQQPVVAGGKHFYSLLKGGIVDQSVGDLRMYVDFDEDQAIARVRVFQDPCEKLLPKKSGFNKCMAEPSLIENHSLSLVYFGMDKRTEPVCGQLLVAQSQKMISGHPKVTLKLSTSAPPCSPDPRTYGTLIVHDEQQAKIIHYNFQSRKPSLN